MSVVHLRYMYQYMYIILTFSMAGIIVSCRYIDFLPSKYEYIFVCQTALSAVVFRLNHFFHG